MSSPRAARGRLDPVDPSLECLDRAEKSGSEALFSKLDNKFAKNVIKFSFYLMSHFRDK